MLNIAAEFFGQISLIFQIRTMNLENIFCNPLPGALFAIMGKMRRSNALFVNILEKDVKPAANVGKKILLVM